MKQSFSLFICILAISASASARTLQPYYLDNPANETRVSNTMGEAERSFFSAYDLAMQQMEAGASMEELFVVEEAIDPADSVSPLLGKIMFDQGTPYNNDCPYLNGGRAVTGCVATAMAEVMAYYRYPDCGTGSVKYTGGEQGEQTRVLDDYPMDWANMLPTYQGGNYNATQAKAVSNLMLNCGAALNMQYSKDGSSSNTEKVPSIMKTNFKFTSTQDGGYYTISGKEDPQGLLEDDFVYTLRDEFKAGRPAICSGAPSISSGGHCFVIDGYKVIDNVYYYHVNWGWNGSQNGYFLITKLTPDPQTPSESYSSRFAMVVGIYPPGWTAVETIPSSRATNDAIYTILGTCISRSDMQHGNIYICGGKKILY